MPNFSDRPLYQWAPHRSTPRRAVLEGVVLSIVGLLCAILALEAIVF